MIELDNKTIVVTFLMHLGDVMLTTPFLHVLRQNAPNSKIIYICDEKLQDLLKYNPNIDELLTVDKKGKDNSIYALYKFGKMINSRYKPDIVINIHPNERASFLALVCGGRKLVGTSHKIFKIFMDKFTPLKRSSLHAADMYIDVLQQMGVKNTANLGLEMYVSDEWQKVADNFLQKHKITPADKIIAFNVGSAVPEKRYSVEKFAQIAEYFDRQKYKIMFLGGPMDVEIVNNIVKNITTFEPIIATGQFTLGPLAALIKRCYMVLTNDSGPMHMTVSQQIPLVALYGPSNPKFYGPYTDKAIVLQSTDKFNENKSMHKIIAAGEYIGIDSIPIEEVIKGMKKMIVNIEESVIV